MRRIERRMRDRLVRPVRPYRRHAIYVEPRPRMYRRRITLYSILIVFLLVFFISFLIICFYLF